jgi:hypothetical protein
MPASPSSPEFLTASDLADAFHVTGSTIRRWSDDGLIPAPQRLPSGRRRSHPRAATIRPRPADAMQKPQRQRDRRLSLGGHACE